VTFTATYPEKGKTHSTANIFYIQVRALIRLRKDWEFPPTKQRCSLFNVDLRFIGTVMLRLNTGNCRHANASEATTVHPTDYILGLGATRTFT